MESKTKLIPFDVKNISDKGCICSWTILDAKNGDILVNGSNIFIFHFINGLRVMGYCHINIDNGRFCNDLGKNDCFGHIDTEFTLATKEQRDLLFQKMKEEGFQWDSDTKELKKIVAEKVEKEVKTRIMTNYELAKWLYEGGEHFRQVLHQYSDVIDRGWAYYEGEDNDVVEDVLIREDGGEWEEPLIEV